LLKALSLGHGVGGTMGRENKRKWSIICFLFDHDWELDDHTVTCKRCGQSMRLDELLDTSFGWTSA